jgi:hypothetical protein
VSPPAHEASPNWNFPVAGAVLGPAATDAAVEPELVAELLVDGALVDGVALLDELPQAVATSAITAKAITARHAARLVEFIGPPA